MNENKKVLLPPGVYSHWCHLFPQISSPPSAFYALLEAALEERKIPKVAISRVYHKEGGLLSAQREYLRMNFDRLVFDVCGAPFGTGFFVSSVVYGTATPQPARHLALRHRLCPPPDRLRLDFRLLAGNVAPSLGARVFGVASAGGHRKIPSRS